MASDLIDSWTTLEEVKLTASDAAAWDQFGISVSISGDTAVVGAYLDGDPGEDVGSAYVFVRRGTSWSQQAKLTASDSAVHNWFGYSVSISGNTAVIGAAGDDSAGPYAGSAYVFVRQGTRWSQQAKLTANDAAAWEHFGFSVSIYGDTAVVGALLDDDGGTDSGSAYVFTRSSAGWSQQAKLTASDAAAYDSFGNAVSISRDTAVVGAPADEHAGGVVAGSAYVFVRSGTSWNQQAKLTASDTSGGDHFGSSVSMDGDTAVVGADWDDHAGGLSGSAYVFVRSDTSWTQQAKLVASDGAEYDHFGYSVSIYGDTAVVGADGDSHGSYGSGSAYVFVRSGSNWSQQAKSTASDAASVHYFGGSVSTFGDAVLVGAWGDAHAGNWSGSAYVFRQTPGPWVDRGHALAGAHGDPALTGTGRLAGGYPVTLALTNALEITSAALVIGQTAQFAPFQGGVMVPSTDILLHLPTNNTGRFALESRWSANMPSALTIYFQYWITDPAGPAGFSASNAISGTTP